jgi:hypothetical protein
MKMESKIPRRPRWKRQFTPSEAPFARREESFRAIWQIVRQSEIFQRFVLSNKDFVQNGMRDLKLHIKTHRLHRSSDPVRQYIPVAELGYFWATIVPACACFGKQHGEWRGFPSLLTVRDRKRESAACARQER